MLNPTPPTRQGHPDSFESPPVPECRAFPAHAPYPFLLPPTRPDEIGRLGNYRVLRLLGKGGMGYVFHAEDLALCRPVALKVMKPDLEMDVRGWQRFLREARVMASIKHESLVTVFGVGQENGVTYLAMELLSGESLETRLAHAGCPDLLTILRLGREIAGGLAAIHRQGLIHRDVKPANLWLEEPPEKPGLPPVPGESPGGALRGRVKILDFGLARFVDDDATLTQTGVILGTPTFMSPEQARGETLDCRSDLFSFGSVLYALCVGTSPFHAVNTTAVLTALALKDPRPVHQLNAAIPEALSELVSQLLAKKRKDRPASAEEVLERLQQIEGTSPTLPCVSRTDPVERPTDRPRKRSRRLQRKPVPRRRWLMVGLVAILSLAVVLLLMWVPLFLFLPGGPDGTRGTPPADPGGQAKVYLSGLTPVHSEHWPIYPPPPPGRPPIKVIGGAMVRGELSPHGIFMHPPPAWEGPASLSYRLDGKFATFHTTVSINDGPPRAASPCTFTVRGDGKVLWQSRPVSTQADTQICAVSVQGVDELKLEVSSAGDPRGAHAVWVEPYAAR
jgi:serine/threonine protein kinase